MQVIVTPHQDVNEADSVWSKSQIKYYHSKYNHRLSTKIIFQRIIVFFMMKTGMNNLLSLEWSEMSFDYW